MIRLPLQRRHSGTKVSMSTSWADGRAAGEGDDGVWDGRPSHAGKDAVPEVAPDDLLMTRCCGDFPCAGVMMLCARGCLCLGHILPAHYITQR